METHREEKDWKQTTSVPVVEERLKVDKEARESGRVVVYVTPHEHEELVRVGVADEEIEVERVEVNRFVDAPEAVRQEGDVTIVPVMEEVAVVQKRLRVKHELRLTRRRKTHEQTERVVLRNEEAQVLRSDVPPESGRDGTTVANASGSSRQATLTLVPG
jgi:stress response protein YsnF